MVDTTLTNLTAASTLSAADLFYVVQSSTSKKATGTQLTTLIAPVGANPTGTIGLSAVNGSAATFMRSDAASAIDQTAAYIFTGLGNTTLVSTSQLLWSTDLILTRSAAAKLQLGAANAASPVAQTLQSQGSRSGTDTNVAGSNLTIASGQGTGNATGSLLIFQTPLAVASGSGAQTMTTRLTVDGAGGVYVPATSATIGVKLVGNTSNGAIHFNDSNLQLSSSVASDLNFQGADLRIINQTSKIRWNDNAFLWGPAAATIRLGSTDAASPVSQILQAQGSRAGTDSNVGGANLTITSGTGTGTGTVSTLILQSPVAVGSGTGAQTQTTGLTIKVGTAVKTNYTVANLPAAATAGAGAEAFVTDANATFILGLGLTAVGGGSNKVPVYSDGTNWIIG